MKNRASTDTQAPSPAPLGGAAPTDASDLADAIANSTVRIINPYSGQWQLAEDGKALIVQALRALRSEMVQTLHPSLQGEWTPRRCLHLGEATQIEELCKLLNGLQSERHSEHE